MVAKQPQGRSLRFPEWVPVQRSNQLTLLLFAILLAPRRLWLTLMGAGSEFDYLSTEAGESPSKNVGLKILILTLKFDPSTQIPTPIFGVRFSPGYQITRTIQSFITE